MSSPLALTVTAAVRVGRPPRLVHRLVAPLAGLVMGLLACPAWSAGAGEVAPAAARASAPIQLRIVGGLASVNQYTRHEEPFWTRTLLRLSNGALQAEIVPFDRAGIRGQDMLRLLQLGAVPFGTALLSLSVAQEPLLVAPDLPGLNPDMPALRRSVDAFRPLLQAHLRDKLGIELLALYA